jgi:hypothetical protein
MSKQIPKAPNGSSTTNNMIAPEIIPTERGNALKANKFTVHCCSYSCIFAP